MPAQIVLTRPPSWIYFARKLKVTIDGQTVASLKNNSTETYIVSEGSHAMTVSMDWCQCLPVQVVVNNGEARNLTVKMPTFVEALYTPWLKPVEVFKILFETS